MALSKSQSATNEILFVFVATTWIFMAASVLTWIRVPIILTFLAFLFAAKVYWFPVEAPEAPVMSACRSGSNLAFLVGIYVFSLFCGSFFARQVTLTDAYELFKGRFLTSDRRWIVYLVYNFCYWMTILLFAHTFRIIENVSTSIAGALRDYRNERRGGAQPQHAEG